MLEHSTLKLVFSQMFAASVPTFASFVIFYVLQCCSVAKMSRFGALWTAATAVLCAGIVGVEGENQCVCVWAEVSVRACIFTHWPFLTC